MERTRTASVDKQQKNTENTLKNSVITALTMSDKTDMNRHRLVVIGVSLKHTYKGRDCGADVIGFSPYYTVSLDWRIAYAYIPFNVNHYYILTSKIPIQKGVSAMPPLLVMSRHSSAWGV